MQVAIAGAAAPVSPKLVACHQCRPVFAHSGKASAVSPHSTAHQFAPLWVPIDSPQGTRGAASSALPTASASLRPPSPVGDSKCDEPARYEAFAIAKRFFGTEEASLRSSRTKAAPSPGG